MLLTLFLGYNIKELDAIFQLYKNGYHKVVSKEEE
jgi:hypothetical protein